MPLAEKNARGVSPRPRFLVDDADDMQVTGTYDHALAIEVLSHLHDRDAFFSRLNARLRRGGRLIIGAWSRDQVLTQEQVQRYIKPIERGMMVSLPTRQDYLDQFDRHGFRLVSYDDLSPLVYKTWDISIRLTAKPALWRLASKHHAHFIRYLKAFRSMQKGYASGAFRYALIVAEKK